MMAHMYTMYCFLLLDQSDKMISLALVIFKFDGVEGHSVLVRPHGNAKSNHPYRRTKESTKNLLKAELVNSCPKNATDKVYNDKGGIVNAHDIGDLPRNRTQAYNMKRKQLQEKMTDVCSSSGLALHETRDMLYVVMEQCKCAEKEDKFVQDVTCAPEPMAVLCNAQQVSDMERFCCNPFDFCILGIDPTFNLGDFSVTVTVYKHLLLQNSSGQSPLLLGPILVHYRKEFRNYKYFLSCVKAVGTDGEKNLVDAALRNFSQAAHIRCFRHLQQNIEMHLYDKQFPVATIKEYAHDMFGWSETNGVYHEGLVDCSDISSFDDTLESLKERWDALEAAAFSDHKYYKPQFHEWFVKWRRFSSWHTALSTRRCRPGVTTKAFLHK